MKLLHTAISFPEKSVKINQFRDKFDNFEEAFRRSGVETKYVAARDETALDLAINAANELIASTSFDLNSLDGLIFLTQTPDLLLPGNSFLFLNKMGVEKNILNYDISQGCAGFVYGTHLAKSMMMANQASRVCLICSDTYSKLNDNDDRGTSMLFGDGCGIVIFDIAEGDWTIGETQVFQLAKFSDLFCSVGGGARSNYSYNGPHLKMEGAKLLMLLSTHMPRFFDAFMVSNNLKISDIDAFIFHQASAIAIENIQNLLNIPSSKLFTNFQHYGNTTSASIPIALHETISSPHFKDAKTIVCVGFGVGFSLGAAVIRRNV